MDLTKEQMLKELMGNEARERGFCILPYAAKTYECEPALEYDEWATKNTESTYEDYVEYIKSRYERWCKHFRSIKADDIPEDFFMEWLKNEVTRQKEFDKRAAEVFRKDTHETKGL